MRQGPEGRSRPMSSAELVGTRSPRGRGDIDLVICLFEPFYIFAVKLCRVAMTTIIFHYTPLFLVKYAFSFSLINPAK